MTQFLISQPSLTEDKLFTVHPNEKKKKTYNGG